MQIFVRNVFVRSVRAHQENKGPNAFQARNEPCAYHHTPDKPSIPGESNKPWDV